MLPRNFFTALYQLDMLTFQCFILRPKRIVAGPELLIGCAELGEVLMSRLGGCNRSSKKHDARFQPCVVQR